MGCQARSHRRLVQRLTLSVRRTHLAQPKGDGLSGRFKATTTRRGEVMRHHCAPESIDIIVPLVSDLNLQTVSDLLHVSGRTSDFAGVAIDESPDPGGNDDAAVRSTGSAYAPMHEQKGTDGLRHG